MRANGRRDDKNKNATPAEPRLAPPKSFWARNEHALLGTFAMTVFLLFWELSVVFEWVNPLFTSAPSRIATTGYGMFADGSIWPHLRVSGYEFIVGFGMAIVVGVPLGILMGWYGRLNAVLDPFVSALYATPRIALLPLIMIWFGIGIESKIAIVFLGAVFPILVNTITGVRTISADFVKVARSFGASDRQLFMTVALPSSVPLLLSGSAARARPRADRHRGRRDVRREDILANPTIRGNVLAGSLAALRPGSNNVAIGSRLAELLGLSRRQLDHHHLARRAAPRRSAPCRGSSTTTSPRSSRSASTISTRRSSSCRWRRRRTS